MGNTSLNPVEREIARNRSEFISEEVGATLIQTSCSPNIKARRDCSAGVYGPDGMLISQAEHIPLHLGLMPTMIKMRWLRTGSPTWPTTWTSAVSLPVQWLPTPPKFIKKASGSRR